MTAHSGSCLCGKVRLRTTGALRGVVFCHCSQCRRQNGHFVAATSIPDERLHVEGGENLTWYDASDGASRGFCATCGALLFWKRRTGDDTSIMAGALDEPNELRGAMHIFVVDKGSYYDIADGLPQHARSTPCIPVDGD